MNTLNIKDEKYNRIINAALEEFAYKSYKEASTNLICNKAKISKGSLFYYFHCKEDLFAHLLEFLYRLSSKFIQDAINSYTSTCIFERLKCVALTYEKIIASYPHYKVFMIRLYEEDFSIPKYFDYAKRFYQQAYLLWENVKININKELFNTKFSIDRQLELIFIMIEGYEQIEFRKSLSLDKAFNTDYFTHFIQFLDELKILFYN